MMLREMKLLLFFSHFWWHNTHTVKCTDRVLCYLTLEDTSGAHWPVEDNRVIPELP